jgi:FkbM family methyltransferase
MLISPLQITSAYGTPKGMIQIGAHYGQEYAPFKQVGVDNFIMIDPVPRHCEEIKKRLNDPLVKIFPTALGNTTGFTTLNLSDFETPPWGLDGGDTPANYKGQSSSILEPQDHISQYPHIKFKEQIEIPITTLDLLIKENHIDLQEYDMLNIDVQGYELEVLKGAAETLPAIKYIYTEVNRGEVYKNCAQVEEIDKLLNDSGFRQELVDWSGGDWGDALYVKDAVRNTL